MDVVVWTKLNTTGFRIQLENDPEWLDKRIEIMNSTAAKSLANQTDKNFTWIIEVRRDTYDYVVGKINCKGVNTCLLPVPAKGEDEELKTQRQNSAIDNYVKSKTFYFVRLNSDDMYHKDFIKTLRAVKLKKDTIAVIPVQGYYWYIADKKLVQLNNPSPPFYAIVYSREEYISGYRLPLQKGHRFVCKYKHQVIPGRMWVWCIHDINNKILRIGKYPSYKKFVADDIRKLEAFK